MKLYNKHSEQQHQDRLETLRQQHEEQIKMVENQKPQPVDFEQVPADGEPRDLGDGIIAMPGDYYNKELGFVVAKGDKAWVPAE